MIIILNGASSSGKSTIAKALNILSPTPFLHIGIDMLYEIMPPSYINNGARAAEGFKLVKNYAHEQNPVDVAFGPYGEQVRNCSPILTQVFEQAKVNVIVDEVLIGDRFLSGYVKTLQNTQTYFVGVTCALEALEERELLRNNRAVGLAASQFHLVHAPERFYDLILDTTSTSPFLCAQRLLDFTNTHPQPTSIQKCAERMGLA